MSANQRAIQSNVQTAEKSDCERERPTLALLYTSNRKMDGGECHFEEEAGHVYGPARGENLAYYGLCS